MSGRSLRRKIGRTRSSAYRGMSISGLEFTPGTFPGTLNTHFFAPALADFQYMATKGFNLVRLPFRWERVQPTLGGALDTTHLNLIKQAINDARTVGIPVMLDVHNYGGYYVAGVEHKINDGTVTYAHFADLWSRLSSEFKNDSNVWGYGLMNEPESMPVPTTTANYNTTATWTLAARAALAAIRATGDTKHITVCLDRFGGIQQFTPYYGANPSVWVTDTISGKLWIEGHHYFDNDYSGVYTTPEWGSGSQRSIYDSPNILLTVSSWAQSKGVGFMLGEVGVPNYDERWLSQLNDLYRIADQYGVAVQYWAMGVYYGSVTTCHPLNNYTEDRPVMKIIEKYQ